MVAPSIEKGLTITKETGGRWKVEFTGRVTQRDMNHFKRMLPVEFARMKRRIRIDRAQEERKASMLRSVEPVIAKKPVIIAKPITTNNKESSDARTV